MSKNPKTTGRMASATADTGDVEIKVTISGKDKSAAEEVFKLDPQKGEQRDIYFFDTPSLELFEKGIILRARGVKGGKDDSTVKIRPVDPRKIAPKWFRMDGFKTEADGVGERVIRSASLSCEQHPDEIKDAAANKRPICKLFSADQESFLAEMSSTQIDFDTLSMWGPVDARRWKFRNDGLPYLITAEEWFLPDGQDLLEVSIKAPSAQAAAAAAAFNGFIRELGLKPQTSQQSKTRVALEFFVKRDKGKKAA